MLKRYPGPRIKKSLHRAARFGYGPKVEKMARRSTHPPRRLKLEQQMQWHEDAHEGLENARMFLVSNRDDIINGKRKLTKRFARRQVGVRGVPIALYFGSLEGLMHGISSMFLSLVITENARIALATGGIVGVGAGVSVARQELNETGRKEVLHLRKALLKNIYIHPKNDNERAHNQKVVESLESTLLHAAESHRIQHEKITKAIADLADFRR